MTAAEKKSIAGFLDITADFLSSGYKTNINNYDFTDDALTNVSPEVFMPKDNINSCGQDSIEQIADEVRRCKNCPLGMTRKNAAPGEGALQPLVMVIGEGPGAEEDAQGRPFVGRAGQLLDKMLASINLSRNSNCFIANVVKCRPPNNRDPYPEETTACAHFLERQISVLKPRFILAAGRISAQTLLKTTEPIGKLRGKIKEFTAGNIILPFLATYHPAALLRNEELKRPAWEDLKLLRSMLDKEKQE